MYRQVEESQTLLINTQSKNLVDQNKRVIKFGFGQSPFMPPKPVLEALKNAVDHKEYSSVQGDIKLRQCIARFHKVHNGLHVTPENILIAPGSKILIYNILMTFENADVFIPTPAWVSYAPQAKLAGHNIIKLETSYEERWRVHPTTINNAVKDKQHEVSIMILNYPGNPDGLTYTEDELKNIAQVAKILNMLVISDEIYGLLNHTGSHLSFANYYLEKTITTTGLSKWCGAGGWRFGVALLYDSIEPEFKQTLIGIGSETYSCAPTPVQVAAKAAYKNYNEMKVFIDQQTQILKQIGNFCVERLSLSGIQVHPPEGGFYIFPDFSLYKEKLEYYGIRTSTELCEQLLNDTGVAILPASAFGFEEEYLAARLAYVDFQEPVNSAVFDLSTDCPNVIEGIEKICNWIIAKTQSL
ncbi:pyridoxal phosphate-dependent aminotransferase [Aquimarina sediminis]|uniref:pyridoxal phosphate-dependent aminotransferase n=1 Tax=Aquimarina sediminis TaxID=2070536 RepID=UPI000CA05FBD|nr:pyridoxal phosphate-dependent aminotransferase [Aquimarina sediminis]